MNYKNTARKMGKEIRSVTGISFIDSMKIAKAIVRGKTMDSEAYKKYAKTVEVYNDRGFDGYMFVNVFSGPKGTWGE